MSRSQVFKPDKLDIDVTSESTAKTWKHWRRAFENFLEELQEELTEGRRLNKLRVLINYLSADCFEYIEECETYDAAIQLLEGLFVKTPNEIFSRHLLATRRQQPGESLRRYMQALQLLY